MKDVSLTVDPGTRTVLLGANGSGKSTLLKVPTALIALDSGAVDVDGMDPYNPAHTMKVRGEIGLVQQRPDDQIVATSVLDEVAFGPENLGFIRSKIMERCLWALEQVGLSGLESREPHTLSGGQKQRLVIAAALAMKPRYILFDEPTSMLDPEGKAEVSDIIQQLVESGVGVLHVTHDLMDAQGADAIVVLQRGEVVFRGSWSQLQDMRIHFEEWGISDEVALVTKGECKARAVGSLRALNAGVSYELGTQKVEALERFTFEIQKGELVMVVGATGSGKSTALRLLAGLLTPTHGQIFFGSTELTPKTARGRIGLVFQDAESALFAETVVEDVMFGPRNLGANATEAHHRAKDALGAVGLDYVNFAKRSPFTLSGGEARRVAIAGVLAMRPEFLLADEPTAALDARGRRSVRQVLAHACATAGVVVVTHAPEEFIDICDRVVVFGHGIAMAYDPTYYKEHWIAPAKDGEGDES